MARPRPKKPKPTAMRGGRGGRGGRAGRDASKKKKNGAPVRRAKRPPEARSSRITIVALGASAGGLVALEQFLQALPADSGVACVIITHQHRGHTTLLPELLSKHTTIPITAAKHKTWVEPNHVYVAPSTGALAIERGRLLVRPADDAELRLPIDHFFKSLALDARERAVGVVLSGNGSDGTLGVTAIKAQNGMVLVQEPSTAQYTGMPTSAVGTQLVDLVLPPDRMPERIVQYVRGRHELAPGSENTEDRPDAGVQRVLAILRMRSGTDFAAYKHSTIRRRIERRMAVHGLSDPRDYARLLEQTPFEADALFREVLISVTSFFREPSAFEALQRELTDLIRSKADGGTLRGWIAGCATGEEAYSVAILVREALFETGKALKVQLFATDLDQHAIDVARVGRYPEGISANVSAERLQRFFSKDESGYRIHKDVRDTIAFASQSVIKDPPFTKLDFVSCRNLLIYLEPDLQKRVLALFGYSLLTDGLLLLGTSESITGFDDRFVTIDKKWKLFRRRERVGARAIIATELPAIGGGGRPGGWSRTPPRLSAGIGTVAERVLLTTFTPPSAIVSERGEIIYLHGRTGPFLEPAEGEPTTNLFHMAREGLRFDLPTAVRQAAGQSEPIVRHGLRVKTNGGFSLLTLTVQRIADPEVLRGTYLVSFRVEEPRAGAAGKTKGAPVVKQPRQVARLEEALQRAQENLQGTIEELEASNEELKSTNEELQSTNEELQSANEELETSREEMQSLNEELQTVNAELEERNRALSQANDDMQNLLNSIEVATVFLDDKLAIKRFTNQAKKVFSLIDGDIGRPIADLAVNLRYTGLVEDALDVLSSLVFREREIQTSEGLWRQMRIMPYRTHDNLIDGLVLTFVDIDRVKRMELVAQQAREYAEVIVDAVDHALVVLDAELRVLSANRAFYAMFHTTPKLGIGEPFARLGDGRWDTPEFLDRLRGVLLNPSGLEDFRIRSETARLTPREVLLSARAIRTASAGPMILLRIEDVSASPQLAQA